MASHLASLSWSSPLLREVFQYHSRYLSQISLQIKTEETVDAFPLC